MKKYVLFLMAVFALLGGLKAQDVEVEGKVESTDVQVGKPFTLNLSLKVPYGWFVEWNDFTTDTLSEQLDIIKRSDVERTADADSNVIVKQQLTLMTFDTGQVQVPPIALKYARSFDDANRLKAYTDPIDLYSTTIAVDTTLAYKPIVEPIAAPVQMKEVFPWILAVLLLALAAFGIWYWRRHRKTKVDADGNIVRGPVIPPYDKAVGDLETLRQQKLWQSGKVKEYYSSLTDIAREYIEGQFGVNAVEMTTDDILEEIKPLHFLQETYDKLKDTMEVADLVKFAKYSSSNLESENAMNSMTEFVNESYAQYQATMSPSASSQMEGADCETQSATMKEEVKDV
ncbi:MAG: hypothetical protein Q4F82_03285 [bacterium]|nr:hypothetical protein [bacterium]